MAERQKPRWVETKLPNHPEFAHFRFFDCKGTTVLFRSTASDIERKRDRVMIEVMSKDGKDPGSIYFGTKFQREQFTDDIRMRGLPKMKNLKKKVDSMLKTKRTRYL